MKVRLVGIDPGKSGAIALLDLGSRTPVLLDVPLIPKPQGGNEINYRELAEVLAPPNYDRIIAVLEGVGPRPTDGAIQSWRFGETVGAIKLAIFAHGYEVHQPSPATWKAYFKLTKKPGETDSQAKERSRGLALQRFPEAAPYLQRKKDHGRAEALLLALYGAEKLYTP